MSIVTSSADPDDVMTIEFVTATPRELEEESNKQQTNMRDVSPARTIVPDVRRDYSDPAIDVEPNRPHSGVPIMPQKKPWDWS
jgi:hypothetical protein